MIKKKDKKMFDLFTFSPKKKPRIVFFWRGTWEKFCQIHNSVFRYKDVVFFKIIYMEFPDIVLFLPSPV